MNATPERKRMLAEASEQAALCSSDLLAALVKAAEARRELLMSVRGKTYDGQDRDNLQWRAQAMDDLAEVVREVIKAANK